MIFSMIQLSFDKNNVVYATMLSSLIGVFLPQPSISTQQVVAKEEEEEEPDIDDDDDEE